ncbi:MAG: hypothetical protein MJY52_00240 [Bacteroidaceae bacterium]|nr:hypothetical protein [Bacteroidaceae bacterium]
MKKILAYIIPIFILTGCSESEYNTSRTPSFNRRYLQVKTTALHFMSNASTHSLTVEADDTPWKINIPTSWATVNKWSGTDSESVDFSVEPNNSADTSRVCVADISADVPDWSRSYAVTLTQAKATPYIQLSQTSLTVDGKSQNQRITLITNVKYKAQSNVDWLSIVNFDDSGIDFSIQENTTGNARSTQVSLAASGVSAILTVVQRAANITTTTESIEFSYEASSATIEVESEASWTAVSSEWIGLSKTSGTAGKSSLSIEVPKNASANSRNGFVYLTIDGTNRVEIPVVQGGITFDISNSNIDFDSFEGTKSFEISSNNSWEVTSCPEWIELNVTSGTGNSTINVYVKENNTTTHLSDKIELATTDNVIRRTVNVSQAAKYIDIDVTTITFTYNEGIKVLSFSTDGSWMVSKDADWFTIDQTSGTGGASLTVHAQENMTLSDREGTIHLIIAGQQYTIKVYQGSKYLTLSSSAFDFNSSTGYTTVSIASNTNWTVSVKDKLDWLTATPSSGSGNADITIGVSENNSSAERTGVIEVEIPNVHTYLINIKQTGKYIRTDRASVDFTAFGGSIVLNVETDGTYEVSKSGSWFGHIKSGDAITVMAPRNDTGTERTGTITLNMTGLTSGSKSLTIPVTQSASSSAKAKSSGIIIKLE